MPYLIDGHNLIPKLGLRLDALDDELELINILQEFCRLERKQVEVYFDGAPAAHAGTRKVGAVTAHFVPQNTTADTAIRKHLKRLARNARNWIVVTSDKEIQADARKVHSEIISSDAFARMLKHARDTAPKTNADLKLSDSEVDEWLRFFEKRS